MSLTSQVPALLTTVMAHCKLPWLVPWVVCSRWLMVTTKMRLDAPKLRSELITAVAVDTCRCLARWLATPSVLYPRARLPVSSVVARLCIGAT